MYEGTKGSTHGETKERSPAENAIKNETSGSWFMVIAHLYNTFKKK